MTLIFSNHQFQYEIERLFRSFFPPLKIKLSFDKADAVGDYCLTERRERGGEYTLVAELKTEKEHYFASEDINRETEEKEQERILSVLLYKVLREYTGKNMPWGILTGVRPVKVLAELSDSNAESRLMVSNRKLRLAREIDQIQRPIIESIPDRSYSLYISIPFCPTRCSYCSFVSHSVDKAAARMDEYVENLIKEMRETADIAKQLGLRLDTIYMGGGTPTTLSADQLKRVFGALDSFDRSDVREFTVEAGRPDTITREKLDVIKAAGADRISVNPQTMSDSVLQAIGRAHTSEQTIRAFALAREAGFDCINMDLIAGLPTDDINGFKASLERVCGLQPENITIHALSLKRAATLFRETETKASQGAGSMIEHAHRTLHNEGYLPYYLYRQKNTADNRENTGYSLVGNESLYNIFIMEEVQSILAVGAGASTKLVDRENGRITRITNLKYPYEYIDRFNEICAGKQDIFGFFA